MSSSLHQPLVTGEALPAPAFAVARFTVDLAELLAPHDMVWQGPLPADWRYGAPLGNGDFGVVLYGNPRDLSLVIGKPDVWDRRNDAVSHHPGMHFDEVRQAFLDGDEAAFKRLQTAMAAGQPTEKPHLTTIGTLHLHLDEGMNPAALRMHVSLVDGTACLRYDDREVTAVVSHDYDVLLVDIDRGIGRPDVDPAQDCYDRRLPFDELPWEFIRPPLDRNPRMEFVESDGMYFATQRFVAGGGYTVGIAIDGGGQAEHVTLPGRLAGRVSDFATRKCRLYLTVVSTNDAEDTVAECRRRLARALEAGAETILAAHRTWWDSYWRRGIASVGDSRVEKWYYRSLYLCGSMLRPGYQSPGLQGVWCGENYPWWSADYHSNVNIQGVYWGLFANNRVELVEPYLRLYAGFTEHAREIARDYYRMRGLKFPHAGSIGGHELTGADYSRLSIDPCESAWVAQLFWHYYRYTGDREYLREIAYPIIRDVALLLADFLVWDEARQGWCMPPVPHFEQDCLEMAGWDDNTLYAQAFFRLGLGQAIAAATELQVDEEYRREWQQKREGLVEPPVTAEGAWQPFAHHEPTFGGHNFVLPLLFPAEEVSVQHGPERWRAQARKTWETYRGRTHSGGAWCAGQGIAEILRLGEVDAAFAGARWNDALPPNGFVIAHPFMQADHGPGMCRLLAEFMVLELGSVIHLFFGIPRHLPARFRALRAPGGFVLTAEKRGEEADYLLVYPTAETTFRLANPWPEVVVTDLQDGSVVTRCADRIIEVELTRHREYLLAPPGFSLDALPVEGFARGK